MEYKSGGGGIHNIFLFMVLYLNFLGIYKKKVQEYYLVRP